MAFYRNTKLDTTQPLNDSRSGLHENGPVRIQRNPLQVWRIQSLFSDLPPTETEHLKALATYLTFQNFFLSRRSMP